MAKKTPVIYAELTEEERAAADLLACGQPVPVAPELLSNPVFVATANRRRRDLWTAAQDRLRALIPQALDILARDLESDDPKQRQAAAIHVLRCVGLYGVDLTPKGKLTPGGVKSEQDLTAIREAF